jgi:hypothetical protein
VNRARRLRKIGSKIPPPFPNGWYGIATSDEIRRGRAKNVECLGEHFVVFRGSSSDEVFVLDAYCPHLGANLGNILIFLKLLILFIMMVIKHKVLVEPSKITASSVPSISGNSTAKMASASTSRTARI